MPVSSAIRGILPPPAPRRGTFAWITRERGGAPGGSGRRACGGDDGGAPVRGWAPARRPRAARAARGRRARFRPAGAVAPGATARTGGYLSVIGGDVTFDAPDGGTVQPGYP
ncbi:hypothetical protein GCM10010249_18250 [Streptomyces roseolilacinus]|uniref:Uncharacterized protein n=1 Tax=Streptomyces roseolilacinus TaxID=66904 RepID=A0A918EJV5_9ACTN|nr:hypothetical protein GCM10010249_18250 [Streptomyces roseolilacinus]